MWSGISSTTNHLLFPAVFRHGFPGFSYLAAGSQAVPQIEKLRKWEGPAMTQNRHPPLNSFFKIFSIALGRRCPAAVGTIVKLHAISFHEFLQRFPVITRPGQISTITPDVGVFIPEFV